MQIENIEALRLWLPTFIAPMSDADPNALAKYVLALVKKDKSDEELKDLCQDQLEVFFRDGTRNFVEKLFEAIQNKSYLSSQEPGARCRPDSDIPSDISIEVPQLPVVAAPAAAIAVIKTQSIKLVQPNLEGKDLKRTNHPSRSRSRSPIGKLRDHDDRRGRKYSDEDNKRRRRPQIANSRRNEYKAKDRRHSNDDKSRLTRERGRSNRSRSNSWTRSRSRSWSDRSRSRSWSRSPDRSSGPPVSSRQENGQFSNIPIIAPSNVNNNINDGSDKDYRMNLPTPVPEIIKEAPIIKVEKYKALSKRCRDFDERGFCLRGELCPYDHGTDPVVVDDMNLIRFGAANQQQPQMPASHHMTQAPVIPPPPPPPPPPESYIPEPYNPEAPGMERPMQRPTQPPFWIPPGMTSMPPPQMGIRPPQMPPSQIQVVPSQVFLAPPPPIPMPRQRELIGVPTIDDRMGQCPMGMMNRPMKTEMEMAKTEALPPVSLVHSVPNKPVMTSHLAFQRNFRNRPYNFNNRKFQGNHRANLSEKCTLELRKVPPQQNSISELNNHFSKFGTIVNLQVNYDGDQEAALIQFSSNQEAMAAYKCTEAVFNNRFIKLFWHNKDNAQKDQQQQSAGTVKERLGEIQAVNNGVAPKNGTLNNIQDGKAGQDNNNVHTLAANAAPMVNRPPIIKGALSSLNNNKPQQKLKEKKEVQKKMTDFQDQKSKMLTEKINQQKKLIDLLGKCKTEKEKAEIKEMIAGLATSIDALNIEIKSTFEEMSKQATKPVAAQKSKAEMQKMLLDTELDLYNKQHSGDDTSELIKKLNSLKQQASKLGIIPTGGKPNIRGRRGALSFRGGRGRGGGSTRGTTNIDRRPKKLFIKGDEASMKKVHSLFNMDNAEITKEGTIVTFKSYTDAEKIKNIINSEPIGQQVSVSLYFDRKGLVSKEAMMELNPNEIIMSEEEDPGELELFDEEEDDDEIGRSWRH